MDHRTDTTDAALADRVRGLMPQLKAELINLVAIPSVSEAGFPVSSRPPLLQARDAVAALFRGRGLRAGRVAGAAGYRAGGDG